MINLSTHDKKQLKKALRQNQVAIDLIQKKIQRIKNNYFGEQSKPKAEEMEKAYNKAMKALLDANVCVSKLLTGITSKEEWWLEK